MAITGVTNFEVNQTGLASDNNGGGSNTALGGADWAYTTPTIVTFNGGGVTASTSGITNIITVTGYTVTGAERGNLLNLTGGSNFTAGTYQVTNYNAGANTLTLDRNCCAAAASGMTGFLGGPKASLGGVGQAMGNASCHIHLRYESSPYLVSGTANTPGGPLGVGGGGSFPSIHGYYQTRGDIVLNTNAAFRPTIKANAASLTLITSSSNDASALWENLTLDGNNLAAVNGMNLGAGTLIVRNIRATGFTGAAFLGGNTGMQVDFCEATACSGVPFQVQAVTRSVAHHNTSAGFTNSGGGFGFAAWCLSYANSGASSHGFNLATRYGLYAHLVAYGNGGKGITGSGRTSQWFNGLAYGNTGNDIDIASEDAAGKPTQAMAMAAPAARRIITNMYTSGLVDVTANPFVDPANGNFALNAYGLTALKGMGVPGLMPMGLTAGFLDIGFQHQDAGGGGTLFVIDD